MGHAVPASRRETPALAEACEAGQTPQHGSRGRNARPSGVPRPTLRTSVCGGTRCRAGFARLGREDLCGRPCTQTRRTRRRSRRACNVLRRGHLPCPSAVGSYRALGCSGRLGCQPLTCLDDMAPADRIWLAAAGYIRVVADVPGDPFSELPDPVRQLLAQPPKSAGRVVPSLATGWSHARGRRQPNIHGQVGGCQISGSICTDG